MNNDKILAFRRKKKNNTLLHAKREGWPNEHIPDCVELFAFRYKFKLFLARYVFKQVLILRFSEDDFAFGGRWKPFTAKELNMEFIFFCAFALYSLSIAGLSLFTLPRRGYLFFLICMCLIELRKGNLRRWLTS